MCGSARIRRYLRPRSAVAALTLLCHFLGSFGLPVLVAKPNHTSDMAFPCQGYACACASAEECWKGDCCCFTLEEKLAWAETNGVEPPSHVRPLIETRKSQGSSTASRSCCSHEGCEQQRSSVRWVSTLMAQRCRGIGQLGLFDFEPTILLCCVSEAFTSQPTDLLLPSGSLVEPRASCPPTPPPRSC